MGKAHHLMRGNKMASFVMPDQVTALPAEQQEAIRKVLIECHLITEAGELANLTAENMPEKYKAALDAFGIETENLNLRLIPLSQVDQYLGLAGRSRNRAEFDFFGRC
jgi:hypothetical protein